MSVFNSVQIFTGAANGYILSSDQKGNATWTNPETIFTDMITYESIQNNSISSVSSSLTPISDMSLHFATSGTYQITFSIIIRPSSSNKIIQLDLYNSTTGITIPNTLFSTSASSSSVTSTFYPITINANATFTQNDTLQARWSINEGTIYADSYRRISAVKIDVSNTTTNIINETQLSSGFKRNVATVSSTALTLDSTYNMVLFSYEIDSSDVIVTLPSAASNVGREYILVKIGNGGGRLIINTAEGNFIDDGTTTQIILNNRYDKVCLICGQSTRWFII